ncbi:ABC transporter ATP-binding protein [Desulfovermiculus halophilus]|uniref:ABC transporter ATP-binding protein n=1 Tax=Desulfovermiculus halophilus TaxID=339722 RepID=UPI000484F6B8|nr:ABC transporter ATP-binding protein [Desulfovermiculus halophilus]
MVHDYGYFEEDQLGKPQDLGILTRLAPFVRPYAVLVGLSLLLVLVITLCELSVPYMTKMAVDRYIVPARSEQSEGQDQESRFLRLDPQDPQVQGVVQDHPHLFRKEKGRILIAYADLSELSPESLAKIRHQDLEGLGLLVLAFLGVISVNFGANFGQRMIMELSGQRIMHDLRMQLYAHVQGLSLSFFNRTPVGRLVTRMTNDVQNLHELFTNFLSFVLKDLFMLLGIAVILLVIHWQLALVSFAVIPLVLVAATIFARRARRVFRILRIKVAEINSRFSETIEGMRVIQLFGREKANMDGFRILNHENYRAGMDQIRILAVFLPLIEVLGFLAMALIVGYGGSRVLGGSLSLGALVAFLSYIRMFFRPLRDMAEKFNLLQNALSSAERIFQILDTKEELEPAASRAQTGEPLTSVEFAGVWFGYTSQEPVLKDISFSLSQGERIAFVGPTGAGKSSLIHLLVRFYDPQQGRILINGRDITAWDITSLRSRMALVMQESFLFARTIRQTLLQGNPELTDREMVSLLEGMDLWPLISRLENGLDTVLSGRGASLSSGERQLLSMARALARDPDILILDEATSSIDSESEQKLGRAMNRLQRGRTSITIAHRLATARHADTIYVLHHGRIVESGSHTQLLDQDGYYARLHQVQV